MDPTEVAHKRQQLQLKYDAKIKPVAKRLQKRLNEIKRQAAGNRHHHSSDKELQDAARKDPNFIADSNLFAKLEAEYEAADAALGGHSAVASGWFGDYEKNSPEEAVLKAIRGIQQHEGFASWWNLPRADVDRPRSPPATHPYETTKKGQPKLDPKEGTSKDHPHATLDEKELSKRLASSHPVRPWAIRIPLPTGLGHVQDSGSAGSPTSWVSATSVGVVVAMCACVAAFTVVRRRQRQSASAAPVVDGYATLV